MDCRTLIIVAINQVVGITSATRTMRVQKAPSVTQPPVDSPVGPWDDNAPHTSTLSPSLVQGTTFKCYMLQSKVQPFLNGLLKYLVSHHPDQAYKVANRCRSHIHFQVALELLLHASLTGAPKFKPRKRRHSIVIEGTVDHEDGIGWKQPQNSAGSHSSLSKVGNCFIFQTCRLLAQPYALLFNKLFRR